MPLVCRNPKFNNLVGDGLPPSPVVGYVDVGNGKLVPFVIGGPNDKNSAIEAARANILIPGQAEALLLVHGQPRPLTRRRDTKAAPRGAVFVWRYRSRR